MDRPNPLGEVASKVGGAWAAVAGIVGALVSFGLLNSAQGDAINAAGAALSPTIVALGTVVGGVLPLVSTLVGAFRTVAAGRNHVTPVSDPRDNAGNRLTSKGQ